MDEERARTIWESEIDRLELDVIRVERLIRGLVATPAEPWAAPPVLGPVPAELRERVSLLLERQQEAQQTLVLALAEAQKRAAHAKRVAAIRGRLTTDPVHLDREA